ncbi:hypothetical protein VTK73DRAFT_1658 [Phialemonium thermophilum]|uniref:Cupin domain-containing protein n=1 Tax=Phialemonium thermophilum TaxID=223376 RepID=A0ABR3VT48_9PEZI
MAPRTTASRRSQAQSDRLFELGVQGRKTGVTLPDTGARDEHGMMPLEDLFSSPEKTAQAGLNNGAGRGSGDENDDDSSGQDMDIENTTAPDPAVLMRGHGNSVKYPLPRSRSPLKTNLQSPARQNPHLAPSSSPIRGSIVESRQPELGQSVKRRLDFSKDKGSHALPRPSSSSSARGGRRSESANTSSRPGPANGSRRTHTPEDEPTGDEETILHGNHLDSGAGAEDSMAMIGQEGDFNDTAQDEGNEEADAEEDSRNEEVSEARAPVSARRGRPRRTRASLQSDANSGGDEQQHAPEDDEEPREGPRKRRRRSGVAEEDPVPEPKKQAKGNARGRKPAAARTAPSVDGAGEPSKPAAKGKRGRPRRSSAGAADTSLAVVPRGPPLPRSRGLLISRREVPGDSNTIVRTRSGRNSYRPLAFWRNEHVDYDQDQTMDDAFVPPSHRTKFVLPTVKEVYRVEEVEPERKRKPGRDLDMFDEPAEPWEEFPGKIVGDAVVWQPEYEYAPPGLDEEVELTTEQLAVAGAAVETREIRNASFRFAKTLSLPFFGAGVVDLPPGSEKTPKNSRKMYMAFFVYMGRVLVRVNDTTFRIGRGGMWFVPRGNQYSIENDYDEPARVFFSQGCETIDWQLQDGAAE